MLMMTRGVGKRLVFTVPPSDKPQQFSIEVDSWTGRAVRMAIDAPRSVQVRRGELEPHGGVAEAAGPSEPGE